MSGMEEQPPSGEKRSLRSGREAKRAARAARAAMSIPYITRTIPLLRGAGRGGPRAHRAQRRHHPAGDRHRLPRRPRGARRCWRAAGADVKGERVRFPRGLCRELVQAPRRANSPSTRATRRTTCTSAATDTVFAPVYGSPFVRDLDKGRRYAHDRGLPQLREARLHGELAAPLGRHGLRAGRPAGEQAPPRHGLRAHEVLRQAVHGLGHAPERAAGHGRDGEDRCSARTSSIRDRQLRTVLISLINANSPMVWDATMLGAAEGLCPRQPGHDHHAVHPGGRDVAGDGGRHRGPDAGRGAGRHGLRAARAAPARRWSSAPSRPRSRCSRARRPSARRSRRWCCTPWPRWRGAWACPSAPAAACAAPRSPDAQAAYESAQHLLPTCLAGVNFVLHAAGWLEGGLAMGYEKFIMDVRPGRHDAHAARAAWTCRENGQAMDAIREVGPGKHFLGCAHTQANFETAFYRSPIADNNSFEQWEAEGSLDAAQRANALLEEAAGRVRGAADGPRRSTRRCSTTSSRRKAAAPDSNV